MSDAEKKEKNVKLKNQVSRIEDMKKLFTFPKETVKLKVKSANPAIEDDTEEVELSKRDFEQLKKKMIINIAWPNNPVWVYSMSDTLHILEINGRDSSSIPNFGRSQDNEHRMYWMLCFCRHVIFFLVFLGLSNRSFMEP